jgi:hypothetical protein
VQIKAEKAGNIRSSFLSPGNKGGAFASAVPIPDSKCHQQWMLTLLAKTPS